jgi:EAL domain-containing protein (putative c-di-GMP-specific phosphodiesterase class I)
MREVETDPSARAIVTTVIRVGQSLQLTVVAEGVETEGQLQVLADLGCDVIQGFFYSPALSPAALGRWLLGHSARRARVMLEQIGRSLSPPATEASSRVATVKAAS